MLEARHDPRLAEETLGLRAGAAGALERQDLQSHRPLEHRVVGEIHGSHAAAPDLLADRVARARRSGRSAAARSRSSASSESHRTMRKYATADAGRANPAADAP